MSSIAPQPKFRIVGADGLALVGGKVYTYLAGTSTPKATYTDAGLGTPNTNPVILNTRGEADIWLDGSYKFIVTDALDVLIPGHTVDNIRDLTNAGSFANPTITGTPVFTSTAVTWSGNPTHSGNHTWSGNHLFNGNNTLGNASTDTLTIAPNAVTWSGNPTHSGNHTWSGTQTFVANPAGRIVADTYTPTVANVTNTTSRSGGLSYWVRIGNVVLVFGSLTVDPTLNNVNTAVTITLPIASAFTLATQCSGVAMNQTAGASENAATITADTVNDVAYMNWYETRGATNDVWSYTFAYLIV